VITVVADSTRDGATPSRERTQPSLEHAVTFVNHLSSGDRYDLIYTVCATSYVDQQRLARYAGTLISPRLVAGIDASSTAPFVSGACVPAGNR
jgi:hypothetical protein